VLVVLKVIACLHGQVSSVRLWPKNINSKITFPKSSAHSRPSDGFRVRLVGLRLDEFEEGIAQTDLVLAIIDGVSQIAA
jgi:hypothetical protein